MQEVDYAVKIICARHPHCFLDLFYGRDRKVRLKGVEDTQLQIPEHRADKIWRVHDGKQEGCVMLEAILVPARRDLRRINLKNASAQITLNMPVITVLLYLQQGNYKTFPDSYEDRLGNLVNSHRFVKIQLWEHIERIRKGELRELAPFLALLYDNPDVDILEIENELIESLENEQERLELKGIAALIGTRKFAEEIVKQKLKLEFPMIRETTIFTEWFDKVRTEAQTVGRAEGHAEGRAEGLVEGEIKVLTKLLERKFGSLPGELKNALHKLNIDESDALAMDLLDFKTIDDLRNWLNNGRHSNGKTGNKN